MAEGKEPHIGRQIRAARERLGWSRETLGSKSGVSWGAIAQMESGRRSKARADTLLALARALGVTIEYLVGAGAELPRMFGHQAFSYVTDEELVETVREFVKEGLDRGEGILVALPKDHPQVVEKGLGTGAKKIEMIDSTGFYETPTRALSVFREFVEKQVVAGAPWARIVAQPPWAGRSREEKRVLMMVEALLDLTFSPLPATVLCPYDERVVDEKIIEGARRVHPHIRAGHEIVQNEAFENPLDVALETPVDD